MAREPPACELGTVKSTAPSTHPPAAASLQKAIYSRQHHPGAGSPPGQGHRAGTPNTATAGREAALLPGTARKPSPSARSGRGTARQRWSPVSQWGRLRLRQPAPLLGGHPPSQDGNTCKPGAGQSADKPPLTQEDLKLPRAETQANHRNPQTQVKAGDPESWRDPEEGFRGGQLAGGQGTLPGQASHRGHTRPTVRGCVVHWAPTWP